MAYGAYTQISLSADFQSYYQSFSYSINMYLAIAGEKHRAQQISYGIIARSPIITTVGVRNFIFYYRTKIRNIIIKRISIRGAMVKGVEHISTIVLVNI